jgi:hypothetical protein
MPSYLAGVEGFEPPNGGIKTRDSDQHNQQVAETADRRVPSSPFDSPSLPPNLPPAIRETAIVPSPARGTTNYLLLSANLRRPTRHPLTLHRFGRRHISASPRTIRRSRGKSHFVSSVEEGCGVGKALSRPGGTQRMRPVVRTAFDPMRPSVISTTMVQHHVKKPIGEFSLTLASMSAIFYLSVN